ncbi:hypothetical protein V491_07878 [Pseudogymnoascus sp. VKM F-3775]|nr:hypothetical protein V491_07878 [Pseudogymnoascus sp. VKM F-3775]
MFAPSSMQQVPPGEGDLNKENAPAAPDAAATAPVMENPIVTAPATEAPPVETDAGVNQPVPSTPLPTSEKPTAPDAAMDPVTQPSATCATTIFNYDEPEESDDDLPVPGRRKRKRNSTNVDYLADMDSGNEPSEPAEKKPGWTMKAKQGPTWKGHEIKHGVPIGVWKMSDEPCDERKHVLFGFLDPKGALHGRKYPERKDGTKYIGNYPSGTGTWAAKANEWLLDPHLTDLSRKELTEYVRIRLATWKPEEKPEEREVFDKNAIAEAKIAAAALESTVKSENKGNSAKKPKKSTPRKANGAKARNSFSEPSSPNKRAKVSEQIYTPSGDGEAQELPTSYGTRRASSAFNKEFKESKMSPPTLRSTPNAKPRNDGRFETPPRERSKYVVQGKDVLIGYWKESSEPLVYNKHAMYGVIQAHGVFRVKVVPETRDGRHITGGNYPKQCGGCWVNYDTCVFEIYLKDLIRTEVEEYCRICVTDPEYNSGNQGKAIYRAVEEAKRIVAEKAAAKGMNIIDYNRKRCDQLEQGAIAREVEKQRRNGEPVPPPKKAEARPTGIRSDKAASDARAQRVRLAKKEAKEAKERETRNSKGDADMAEAMRRSASEQEKLAAQKKANQNSDASSATSGGVNSKTGTDASRNRHTKEPAYNNLKRGSSTSMSGEGNTGGSENGKMVPIETDVAVPQPR